MQRQQEKESLFERTPSPTMAGATRVASPSKSEAEPTRATRSWPEVIVTCLLLLIGLGWTVVSFVLVRDARDSDEDRSVIHPYLNTALWMSPGILLFWGSLAALLRYRLLARYILYLAALPFVLAAFLVVRLAVVTRNMPLDFVFFLGFILLGVAYGLVSLGRLLGRQEDIVG